MGIFHIPCMNGIDVLERLRGDLQLQTIPVVHSDRGEIPRSHVSRSRSARQGLLTQAD